MFNLFRRKAKKNPNQTILQPQKEEKTAKRKTIPRRKHKPPSMQRYDTAHPTIAFRLDAELKGKFLTYLEEKGQTPAQLISQILEAPHSKNPGETRIPLGQQVRLAYEAGKREGDKGKQAGYTEEDLVNARQQGFDIAQVAASAAIKQVSEDYNLVPKLKPK